LSEPRELTKRGRILCAVGSLTSAAVVGFGVFLGLPSRWAPVDVTAGVVTLACAASGGLMLFRAVRAATPEQVKLAERVARIVSAVVLLLGLGLVVLLAATAGYLSGIYGPVGKGGAMVLVFVALLAVPYLIALPAAQLLALGPRRK
jgi:hypothetical protein